MASSASSVSSSVYQIPFPGSNDSDVFFAVNGSSTDLTQLNPAQTAKICGVSKKVFCNICLGSAGALMVVTGSILTGCHQEMAGVPVIIAGVALSCLSFFRMLYEH